jgi:hypothetical protein
MTEPVARRRSSNRGGSQAGWVPSPDPTKLTTDAVNAATAQWRRDLDGMRDLIAQQIDAKCGALVARLDAMDEATALRLDAVREVRPQTERQINHLKELHGARFDAIAQQFAERDIRTDHSATTTKEALAAALQAAKELVTANQTASALAAERALQATEKRIEQIDLRIRTLQDGIDARLGEMKDRLGETNERIGRGEGGTAGAATAVTERRLDTGQMIAIVVAAVMMLSVVVTILIATR